MSNTTAFRPSDQAHHRPDIDGLRAIAILSVLGYHGFGNLLPGGFVGVDVFFVISGYLISGIILRGLQQNSFSFIDFYVRRIRRIFPALALVLLVVWAVGWYAQLPDEYSRLGKHIASGAAFVANISLWREAGYFDQSANLKPLLHLWSLGVEEQFYLFWPFTLFAAWRLRLNLFWTIAAILLASFALNILRVSAHEAATFYLPTTRLWELLLGGLFACWERFGMRASQGSTPVVHGVVPSDSVIFANAASCCGLALILVAVFILNRTSTFPGWWAAVPTLGSVLLVAGGMGAWINRRLLASRPMVFFGLISYPLYLWHWPLLSFSDMFSRDGVAPSWVHLALLLLAVVLAWLTYRFIERPIRSSRARLPVAIPLAGAVAVMGAVGVLSVRGVIAPRSASYGLNAIIAAANGTAFPGPHLVNLDNSDSPLRRQGANAKTVLFIGDSFIEQYYPRVDWLLDHHPSGTTSVVYASNGGCPPIPDVREDHHLYCKGLLERALQFADRPEVSTVVIGANWMGYFQELDSRYAYYFARDNHRYELLPGSAGTSMALSSLQAMMERLSAHGRQVYLILQSPNDEALDPLRMIGSRWGRQSFRISVPVVSKTQITSSIATIEGRLEAIASASGAHVIDPIAYLCSSNCLVVARDGQPVYRDGAHLNPSYVRTQVHFLDGLLSLGAGGYP